MAKNLDKLSNSLLDWYQKNGIDYPFRNTSDPYKIMVSEILLRQTRAQQVSRIYDSFFNRFPDVKSLAKAQEKEIRKKINPLGITSRAKQLLSIAKKIAYEYDNIVPNRLKDLIAMKGIGEYTAYCILSFGYEIHLGEPVDTNINRVISRILGIIEAWPAKDKVKQTYSNIAGTQRRRMLHHALIDVSHMFCRPRTPACMKCPIQGYCARAMHAK